MSVKAKLIVDAKEIKVLKFHLSFNQVTDVNGRIVSIPIFEGLHLVIETQKGVGQ